MFDTDIMLEKKRYDKYDSKHYNTKNVMIQI